MSDRPFITFQNNKVYVIELLYDKPKEYTNDYGDQHIYAFMCEGQEYVKSEKVGSKLDLALGGGKKGDLFTLQKARDPETGYYPFIIEKGDTSATRRGDPNNPSHEQPTKSQSDSQQYKGEPDWDLINATKAHDIHKQTCLKMAVSSLPPADEFDEKEIIKRYTRLLSILEDNLEVVMHRMQQAENMFHLQAIWTKHGRMWMSILTPDEWQLVIEEKNRLKEAFQEPDDGADKLADAGIEADEKQEEDAPNINEEDEPLPF